jgi:transcriptional regulator with XRE-family HTH domain
MIVYERGDCMTVGERLYKLRKEKNISQEELANVLDVSRQTISKWETGESTPDFNKICPLCEYYGITSDELLTGAKIL